MSKHNLTIVLLIFLGIATILFFGYNLRQQSQQIQSRDKFTGLSGPQVYHSSPREGNEQANLVVFEFADFACPACKTSQPIIEQIYAQYGKQILHVWKDVLGHGNLSERAAIAARCAGEQEKFWQYHGWLFDNQERLGVVDYQEGARVLLLDEEKFKLCLDSDLIKNLVKQDDDEAFALGIDTTPTFIIGEAGIVGVASFAELERTITEQLEN